MKPAAIIICILCQLLLVAGQVFLKHALNRMKNQPASSKQVVVNFTAGIGSLTAWFLLWVGLLQQWELSRIFPFEGLNPALLVIAAAIFLREKLPVQAWLGVALICLGIAFVSGS